MPHWWDKALSLLAQIISPKFMFFVALLCTLLLFAPHRLLELLSLTTLVTKYRGWLGLGLIIGILYQIPFSIGPLCARKLRSALDWRYTKNRLENLSLDQQAILLEFVRKGSSTSIFPLSKDGLLNTMSADGILYRSSQLGHVLGGFPYSLYPRVEKYILANQEKIFKLPRQM